MILPGGRSCIINKAQVFYPKHLEPEINYLGSQGRISKAKVRTARSLLKLYLAETNVTSKRMERKRSNNAIKGFLIKAGKYEARTGIYII